MARVYNTITGYRDADYDIDDNIDKTASFPDGLHEDYTCVPGLKPKGRRTSSSADISRFYRYFELAQSNRGRFFTWKHYLKILQDELMLFDADLITAKMSLRCIASPLNSEVSNYATASEYEEFPLKNISENHKRKKRTLLKQRALLGDAESICSGDTTSVDATSMGTASVDTISLTPQTNVLKKMCNDIRSLARKTIRTAEKISTKSKYCPTCGEIKTKYCVVCGDIKDYSKPLTPSSIRDKLMRSESMTFNSHVKTPVGGGEATSRSSKLTFAPRAFCRNKPLTKNSRR